MEKLTQSWFPFDLYETFLAFKHARKRTIDTVTAKGLGRLCRSYFEKRCELRLRLPLERNHTLEVPQPSGRITCTTAEQQKRQIQNSAEAFKLEQQARQAKRNPKKLAKPSGDKHGGRHQGGGGRVFDTAKQARSEKAECEAILRVSMPTTSTQTRCSDRSVVLLIFLSRGSDRGQGRWDSWLGWHVCDSQQEGETRRSRHLCPPIPFFFCLFCLCAFLCHRSENRQMMRIRTSLVTDCFIVTERRHKCSNPSRGLGPIKNCDEH